MLAFFPRQDITLTDDQLKSIGISCARGLFLSGKIIFKVCINYSSDIAWATEIGLKISKSKG